MTAESIALSLRGRRSGPGWVAPCPAHDDRRPSLSLRDADGRVLVHCFTGCPQDDVIAALRARGLWPERERPTWTPAERVQWAHQRQEIERELPTARLWRRAAVLMAEDALTLLKAGLFDPASPQPVPGEIQRAEGLLAQLKRVEDAELVNEYLWWLNHHPGLTAALVAESRRRERAERRALAAFLRQISEPGKVTA